MRIRVIIHSITDVIQKALRVNGEGGMSCLYVRLEEALITLSSIYVNFHEKFRTLARYDDDNREWRKNLIGIVFVEKALKL